MFEWHSVADLPEQEFWVLVFRSRQPHAVRYEPFIVVYRSGDQWISTFGRVIDNVTHWAHLNPPMQSLNGVPD